MNPYLRSAFERFTTHPRPSGSEDELTVYRRRDVTRRKGIVLAVLLALQVDMVTYHVILGLVLAEDFGLFPVLVLSLPATVTVGLTVSILFAAHRREPVDDLWGCAAHAVTSDAERDTAVDFLAPDLRVLERRLREWLVQFAQPKGSLDVVVTGPRDLADSELGVLFTKRANPHGVGCLAWLELSDSDGPGDLGSAVVVLCPVHGRRGEPPQSAPRLPPTPRRQS